MKKSQNEGTSPNEEKIKGVYTTFITNTGNIVCKLYKKGMDWVSWAVTNENGKFDFSKKAFDTGLAWGMFVEVK